MKILKEANRASGGYVKLRSSSVYPLTSLLQLTPEHRRDFSQLTPRIEGGNKSYVNGTLK